MNIFRLLREIEIQTLNYKKQNNGKEPLLIMSPKLFFGITMEMKPGQKPKLFGAEVELSQSLKENEFILGEKFEVQDDQKD